MCFNVDTMFCPNGDNAKRDLPVYKVFIRPTTKERKERRFKSPYQRTSYTLRPGSTFHAKEERSRNKLRCLAPVHRRQHYDRINEGLHSYRTLRFAKASLVREVWRDYVFVKFVIPAGTPFYENREERVSLTLRYVKEIKQPR
jgi:hypothetical protein